MCRDRQIECGAGPRTWCKRRQAAQRQNYSWPLNAHLKNKDGNHMASEQRRKLSAESARIHSKATACVSVSGASTVRATAPSDGNRWQLLLSAQWKSFGSLRFKSNRIKKIVLIIVKINVV